MTGVSLLLVVLSFSCAKQFVEGRFTEEERVAYWHEHHKQWPPNWHKESESYRQAMAVREAEIMSLPGSDERWENWMQFIAGRLVHNFTKVGFEVVQTPPEFAKMLADGVADGVSHWDDLRYESPVDAIFTRPGMLPKFVDMHRVTSQVHKGLLSMHEKWAGGIKLRPTSAYGVRLYQNGSSLAMHIDKTNTHVISSIVHIAHKYDNDSEPWPIEIEDHDGVLHAVNLEPGQMLFYESAKCLHGRRSQLKGKYYGSVFLHYMPVDKKIWNYTTEDIINAVPPHWHDNVVEQYGSRWAGQAITTDSRIPDGAPPRLVGNANPRNKHRRIEL